MTELPLIPWTVSWTGESRFFIQRCPYANNQLALCQNEAWGVGKPDFGKPHSVRQRKAMALRLCDICGRPLKGHTSVSLSQESPRQVTGIGFIPLAVEPMVHRGCALHAMQRCPALRRQAKEGILRIRQVYQARLVAQQLNAAATLEFAGVEAPGAVGHLKLAIVRFADRDAKWLGVAP
jgi:hypothetical protein